ncbi:hypothetical protein [Lichenicola sp.]|uniref:hypothetical protein n=1 Tax=Lichenicola sp. TaxID=2804529 RepID=UPI003B0031B4
MRDPIYWQRLRRDKASGLAALFAIGACGVTMVGLIELLLPSSQANHRENPFYWMLLLPFGWWGVELVNYTPRISWTLVPALGTGPAVALVCAATSWSLVSDNTAWLVILGVSVLFGLLGAVFYSRSMLRREGPAR